MVKTDRGAGRSQEDIVDEYIHNLVMKRCNTESGFVACVHKAFHFAKSMTLRYDIASEIRDINESLRRIKENGRSYGLRPLEDVSSSSEDMKTNASVDPRLSSLFIDEDDLVGIDSPSKELIKCLVEGPSSRVVISLVGEGGIGKTTLAKKVYDDDVVKGNFDCHVWITVSQSYNIQKVLKIIRSQICSHNEQPKSEIGTIVEEISHLRNYLETKRYVVVFDDVWVTKFWEDLKHAFPCKNTGSRIIITTRNTSVANFIKETPFDLVQELKPWPWELAWELFCKKAFPFQFEGRCPQVLDHLSREMVKKCQGLPLVIVALAGLLSTKEKTEFEWQRVLNDLHYDQFENNPQLSRVPKVLSLSYRDLPYHLKSCFLYFGNFPEDYSISETRLCRLWIAEGFIESKGDHKTLEHIAKEYLNELIHRNLVSFNMEFGFLRRCQVHDLMHDMILARGKELRFCQILDGGKPRFKGKSRRISVYNTTKDALKIVADYGIRTTILVNIDVLPKSFVVSLFKNFKLLKVLDFKNTPLDYLPKEVGNLLLLKFLNLQGTKVKMLPKSIGNVHNLQMLNLSDTLVEELPSEINKLSNLQHLVAHRYNKENECSLDSFGCVMIHKGIGCLEKLQTLTFVEANDPRVGFVKELEKLTKLETLGIGKVTAVMGKALGVLLGKMNHLEELFMNSISTEEILDLNCNFPPPPFLRYISLRCRLQEFPNWISRLQNLRGLSLRFSRLTEEPLKSLKGLPNLTFVRLYQAYDGEELHFEEGGFQNLKQLTLGKLEGLQVVKINRGALPLLEELDFEACPLMQEMPSDIKHLTNLKSLKITDMPKEFVAGLQPNGGPHYWKIKHVPSVSFRYKRGGWTTHDVYKLGEANLLQLLQQ